MRAGSSVGLGGAGMRKRTWFAIAVCVVAVLPGLAVGALAAYGYHWLAGPEAGYNPDFLMQWIYLTAIPIIIHGGLAGAFAVFVTRWICKGARYDLAAYATGALYSGIVLILLIYVVRMLGVTKDAVGTVIQIAGLWIGLIAALAAVRRAAPMAMA